MENMEIKKPTELGDAAEVLFLTGENAFFKLQNELLMMKLTGEAKEKYEASKAGMLSDIKKDEEEDKPADKKEEKKPEDEYFRVYLHRAFPFDDPGEYISVQNYDKKEVGLIKSTSEFDAETEKMLLRELDIKYYAPKILKIHSVKERFGFSYWTVTTDNGDMQFTLQDTYRSMMKVSVTRIIISDIDGNRYEIPNVEALDHKSYRKIELYL